MTSTPSPTPHSVSPQEGSCIFNAPAPRVIELAQLQTLLDALIRKGYCVIGPRLRDKAIQLDALTRCDDFPVGWKDQQEGGVYRVVQGVRPTLFDYNVGPQSWKQFLFPPAKRLWEAHRKKNGFEITPDSEEPPRFAFFGVRPCEVHAIAVQDQVFLKGPYVDSVYRSRRENVFIVAVNCTRSGGTCFCVSMKTGPHADSGFDLSLTEVVEPHRHYFLLETGSSRGLEMLESFESKEAGPGEIAAAQRGINQAASQMGRTLDTVGIKEVLYNNYEHPRWEDAASRCLSCGNCTLACPTCFCSSVEDVCDITDQKAERWRRWDSCFTLEFSYIYGGSVRTSTKARYRQWLIHKLGAWLDQFGSLGCVGCGRCITWCPVGIDITAEAHAIRESKSSGALVLSLQENFDDNP